jgi:peptidyl-prolyl cis-trans isomerase SurA
MRYKTDFKRNSTMRCHALRAAAALCALALLPLLLAPVPAFAQTRELASHGELLDRVAAVVNDGLVLKSELSEQMIIISARLKEQNLELPPQNVLQQQVLERLVLQEVEMQRAKRLGVTVPDETLNNALQDVAERNKMTLAQLPQELAKQGIDYPAYRESMRRELTLTLLRQRDVVAHIYVSPREITQFMERQKNKPSAASEYNVSHILIAVPQASTADQLDEAEKHAKDVYERAKRGEDFAKLAVAYSNAQTALDGGALGWRKGPELPTFLADLVVKMKPGDVSEPLRTPSGFHLVRLNEVRSADSQVILDQVHARHILMKTTELLDDATVQQKLNALRERILKGEDFAGIAKVSSEDPGSAVEGGDLGWTGPGTFVPEFEKVLAGLKENELSEPFHTQFGWHIVQLLGRRKFDGTDDLRRQKAFAQLRESKADEETELWLRRLRDEAYVETKM